MLRMRLLVVVMLLAVVLALPASAVGPVPPRINGSFPETDPIAQTTTYSYDIMCKDNPLRSYKLYAPLGAQYIDAFVAGVNGQRDTNWVSTVTSKGTYSEILWECSSGLNFGFSAMLRMVVPSWTTTAFMYVPPELSGTETNWAWEQEWSGSYSYFLGPTQSWMPVPEGVVPEPASLASLASLGVLLVGAVKRRK